MQKYTNETYLKGSKNSYLNVPNDIYDKSTNSVLDLIVNTKTIDFYLDKKNKNVFVTVRGTKLTDLLDIKADFRIALNSLRNSTRYIEDKKIFKEVMNIYPPEEYSYYFSAHSLGSAIVSLFLDDFPHIDFSITFNGAVQPRNVIYQNKKQKYYYIDEDFLYNNSGFLMNNKEVLKYRPEKVNSFFEKLKHILLPKTTLLQKRLRAHNLDNFDDRI